MAEDKKSHLINVQEATLGSLNEAQSVLNTLTNPATRIIGHVIFSPEISARNTDTGGKRLRDWALIELDPAKHSTPFGLLKNRVMIGDAVRAREEMMAFTVAESGSGDSLGCKAWIDEEQHTVSVSETIPETEMKDPMEWSRSTDDPTIFVAKYGNMSKLTVGLANNVLSLTRQPFRGGQFNSEEWCIIGPRPHRRRRMPFSNEGDSGSCVWDLKGRIGDMITGGSSDDSNGTFDTTYATPIEWLLQDIKGHAYDVGLV